MIFLLFPDERIQVFYNILKRQNKLYEANIPFI